ncbi:TIGR02186 family protein [Zavarzinia sp. CC-PAN008]|uniref:TIGR02186 family protein n=1 Tax=Zavarzinia sp. CC-PAN008 TaxID=3243332 RepID=UPI003F745E55
MRRLALLLVLALGLALTPPAGRLRADSIITDLSDHLIAINSSFTGARILLFGALDLDPESDAPRDIVVVLRGPEQRIVVRRKDRVLGVWANRAEVTLADVPGYYAIAASRPLAEIASASVLRRNQIGVGNLRLSPAAGEAPMDDEELAAFRAALSRLKEAQNLYVERPLPISFPGPTFFRTSFELPSAVPVGNYRADVYLFRDGQVVSAQSSPLFVDKIGIERLIFILARDQGAAYGVIAILIAIAAGWSASLIFRQR